MKTENIAIGDKLYRTKYCVEHVGTYIGNGWVLHNSPTFNVKVSKFNEFALGRDVKVIHSKLTTDEQAELLFKVGAILKTKEEYHVLSFNCEHLATKFALGKPHSEQLQIATTFAMLSLFLTDGQKTSTRILTFLGAAALGCGLLNASRKYDLKLSATLINHQTV
ncbi:NlpC/P60 family protein [Morganella morganii]|nr:NlpC/P60 family protein [Morganella morganii]